MKNILITGINSYIGNQFSEWINQWPDNYSVNKISVRNQNWKQLDFSKYDVVLHVAGIAHNSSDANLEELYYRVNRDLTTEIAEKAKNEGVPHFINMSSIIVFGTKNNLIKPETIPNPDNFYGDSKLQAEKQLIQLVDQNFKIAHVRPPMVYGKDSKGNFPILVKLASKTPVFPNYENKRSMIYVKNLSEFLRLVIDNTTTGYLHPQNSDFVKTSELVEYISKARKHKVVQIKFFNFGIKLIKNINLVNKVFGDLYYSKEMNDGGLNYQKYTLQESIIDIFDK
ncbi:NAD-dependent epimerase/dehydratase family protein [Aerococcus sp. L_4]